MRKYAPRAICVGAAYFSTCAVSELMNRRGEVPFSHSVASVLLWGLLSVFYVSCIERWIKEEMFRSGKRRLKFAGGLSLLLGTLTVIGYELQWGGYTMPGIKAKLLILIQGAFVGAIVFPFVEKLFAWSEGRDGLKENDRGVMECAADEEAQNKNAPNKKAADASERKWSPVKIFFFGWIGIWLCWIPVWLAYYPVIMSYDFHRQSLEALWGYGYFDMHHPVFHTWLLFLFRSLGEIIGSFEVGFACYSLMQQMIVAAILGYACAMVYRLTGKKWVTILTGAFFGTFPLVSVMVMCTTKDVFFGAFFILFLLLFMERSFFTWKRTKLLNTLWVLSGVMMMLFRNNAIYAMVVFGLLFIALAGKKMRLKAAVWALVLVVCGKGAILAVEYGFGASEGNPIEKYSVIYQCMARVGNLHGQLLSEEDYELIDRYVTSESWVDYNPYIADSIKTMVHGDNMVARKTWDDMGEVIKAWLTIGLRYPDVYLDAFLNLTRGYWFFDDTSHAEMLGVGLDERMGLLYTYNSAAVESLPDIEHVSYFPWLEQKLELIVSANVYYKWPVISNLFKPAVWCWLLVVYELIMMYRKDRKRILVGLYPLVYFGTMLLGPTAIVRYVFQFVLLAPLLLALVFAGRREKSISIR